MANEWNTGFPIDHTKIGDLPGEDRKLKASVKTQLDHEHETPVDGDATGSEHSSGSAVAYEGTVTPTNRPDGVTALGNNAIDRGRLWLDDNFDPPKLKRWTGSAFTEAVNGGEVDGSTVFNTSMTSANTFQDLDLSSEVGANSALVHLEVAVASNAGTNAYAAKTKGYGSTFALHNQSGGDPSGGTVVSSDSGGVGYGQITLMTNSSGVIQHGYSDNSTSITIKLIGYMRMG